MHIDQASQEELQAALTQAEQDYAALADKGLALDITRGKPSTAQVALSDDLDGILNGEFIAEDGTDVRNYGGLDGLPEAKRLFGAILDMPPQQTLIGGNGSLTLMFQCVDFALRYGFKGPDSAWQNRGTVKFLCPTPGYDRHFAICEHLGIELISVPLLDDGPDMDKVEALVQADTHIAGIWCVPRFSNPTGCVYSDATVERIARLGELAGDNFLVLWDNAYAVHSLYADAPQLASIARYCEQHGTQDSVLQFGSTSKVTMGGAGVSFMASSEANVAALKTHLSFQTIGPDKVNQLRHVRFLRDADHIAAHMAKHADIIRPRFESVLSALERELGGSGMGHWTKPQGGYFISFDSRPGLAKEIVRLAGDIGVKLTPAGATFPYGEDPEDSNIRIAPTYPSAEDTAAAADAFTVCVKLASLRQRLTQV